MVSYRFVGIQLRIIFTIRLTQSVINIIDVISVIIAQSTGNVAIVAIGNSSGQNEALLGCHDAVGDTVVANNAASSCLG